MIALSLTLGLVAYVAACVSTLDRSKASRSPSVVGVSNAHHIANW